MSYFNQVSPDAEELLQEIINVKEGKNDGGEYWHNRFDSMESDYEVEYRSLFAELKLSGLILVDWADDIPYFLLLTSSGKNYFIHKEIWKQEFEMNKSNITHINIGDNSPVNLAIDGGVATQTIDYANNEQIKELSTLADMINSAQEFNEEERKEIFELIDGVKEASKHNKKSMLKSLMVGLGAVLAKAPSFIVEKWNEIQAILGGQ